MGSLRWVVATAAALGAGAGLVSAVEAPMQAGGSSTVATTASTAFSQTSPALPPQLQGQFFLGRSLFRQLWLVAPAPGSDIAGLGPVFNRPSCAACHLRNGRGAPPESPEEPMRSMLVRLSLPGTDAHGGPRPHPAYGDQLNDAAVPGVPPEGRARVSWEYHAERLADGEIVELRRPRITFTDLAFGALGPDILISPRIAPPIIGAGFLEAVPEQTVLALSKHPKPGGVRGHANYVWDVERGRLVLGRFGWKANAPSLRQQVAAALSADLGITNSLFPEENCTPAQTACRAAPSGGTPEASEQQVAALVLHLQGLGVPARRAADDPQVSRGEALFQFAGCDECHWPTLRTGEYPDRPWLAQQTIQPYTDLLVHDMGEDLADGRPDFEAGGREWRTQPLWGIGLTSTVSDEPAYLHDGRARTLLEAILWHGGEAESSRRRILRFSPEQRAALLRFLESL